MGNPIKNLGDYNIVREALQAVGGSKEILYKSIGDTAVSKAAPKIFLKGSLVGGVVMASIIGVPYLGYKGYHFLKNRTQKIEDEHMLKKQFDDMIQEEYLHYNDEKSSNINKD